MSLNDMCNELDDKFGCNIKKQSIDERFNTNAVDFLKVLISKCLSKKIPSNDSNSFMNNFTAIKIQDSTSFQISENLSEHYGGSGGAASSASARVQFEYDIKNMNISTLELTSGLYQDVSYSNDKISTINKGDLVIRDLGYISAAWLQQVIEREAYFVNRIKNNRILFVKDSSGNMVELDFCKLLSKMKRNKINVIEHFVYIPVEKEYIGMRLITEKLPDAVYAERVRKAKRNAQKKGYKLSKEYLQKAWFNLFVTNVDETVLKSREVNYLYSLRWQIELVFKSWKSTFKLAKIKKMKKERFECQIYARLLLIIMSWNIFSTVNNMIVLNSESNTPCTLSYYKFNKLISARLESFMLAIIFKGMWLKRFLTNLVSVSIQRAQYIEEKSKTMASSHIIEYMSFGTSNESGVLNECA